MYTVHNRTTDGIDTRIPVEGLRDGWQDRVVGLAKQLKPQQRDMYLYGLRALASQFTPPAYMAAEPIIRFEAQLAEVIARIAESEG